MTGLRGTVRQVPIKRSVTPSGKTRVSGGQWFWQCTLHDGPHGQITRRGYRTRGEAQHDLNEFVTAHGRGETRKAITQPSTQPLGDYLLAVWLAARAPNLKESTAESYAMVIRCWIVPYLGDCPLASLTGARISTWHAALRGRPLGSRSVQYANRVLAMSLGDALEAGLLAVNPMTEVPKRQRPQHSPADPSERKVWSVADAKAFLAARQTDRLLPLWSFLLATGCRRGEALAARWDDIDWEHSLIKISRTRTPVRSSVIETSPKNKKSRPVDLDPDTLASLRRWRARQSSERLRAGQAWTDSEHVFTDELGRPYHPTTISSRFLAAVAKAGVPKIGIHVLRHTNATWSLSARMPVNVVAARLGHDPAILLKTYAHLMAGDGQTVATHIGAQLFG